MTKEVQIRRKWRRWLKTIGHDLGNLLTSRDIHEQIRHMIVSLNKRIKAPSLYYNWLVNNYVDSITIRIRRLGDHDRRCISLYRLIEDILENRSVLTRDYYVSRYPKWMQEQGFADRDFDNFAKKRSKLISERKLEHDMRRLDKDIDHIRKFANRWIAHCDLRRRRLRTRTHKDVDSALKDVDELFCKYNLLVTRGGMTTAKPVLQFDWREPLRHAWIENEQKN
jgi:hypothetical protein